MSTEERSLTPNQRIAISGGVWLLVGPLVIAFFFMSIWVDLMMLVMVAWTTYDDSRRRDMAGHVASGTSKQGFFGDGMEESFGRNDDG